MAVKPYHSNIEPTLAPSFFFYPDINSVATFAANILTKHSEKKYQKEIPDEIESRAKSQKKIYEGNTKRERKISKNVDRVTGALKTKKAPEKINSESLTEKRLAEIAKDVNGSLIHCSGNCVLLSRAMLYNLAQGKNILSVRNTTPFYEGFDDSLKTSAIDRVIFGKPLTIVDEKLDSIDKVVTAVLDEFSKSKERYYLVESEGFDISIAGSTLFSCGHDFNAVVMMDDQDKPYVQFVDAWKTSDFTPSEERMDKRYSDGIFTVKKLS